MKIVYREFKNSDEPQVKKHITELVKLMALKNNPLRLLEPAPEYTDNFFIKMSEHINKRTGMIFVAEIADNIVGYVIGHIKKQTPEDLWEYKPIKMGYVPDLFVTEAHRGQGIGLKLLQIIEDYLIRRGCKCIEISVAAKNIKAYRLYQKQGYQDQLIEMIKFII